MNWFKKQSMIIKVVVVVIGLFVLSAVVSGVYDGIFGEDEASTESKEVAKDSKEDKEKLESEKKEKEVKQEPKKEKEEPKKETDKKKDDTTKDKSDKKKKEAKEPKEDQDKKIKLNKEIELDNINLEIENVYVEDNKLKFGFWWNHWASNDKIHFSVLAYPVVEQNGEELEQEDKNDSLLKQTAKGVDSRVDLEYKLIDNSPVTIKFKTTSDDPVEESFEVDIK